MAKGNSQKSANSFALDFEAQLWAAADKMRGHTDVESKAYFMLVRKSVANPPVNMYNCGDEDLQKCHLRCV